MLLFRFDHLGRTLEYCTNVDCPNATPHPPTVDLDELAKAKGLPRRRRRKASA
jgi:hypothetical protein